MNSKRLLGKTGELIAQCFLILKGYRILKVNYRTPYGEIDIITQKNQTINFLEIKYRKHIPSSLEIVSYKQKQRIEQSIQYLYYATPPI